ncbi:recombinase family protein [Streptomyces scabiei]|uniref:recombinase family protein n=1 Tax=Streptomyces scabiei TaxID=1930 RepID=UPI0037A62CBA
MTTFKAGATYARISKADTGDTDGVTRQGEDTEALALRRGIPVDRDHRFTDNDLSATQGRHRPDYERLTTAVTSGAVDVIVVYALSRLWRNRRERTEGIELLRQHGVSVLCVKGPELDLTTASGRLLAELIGAVDTFEVEQLAERSAREVRQRVERGEPPTGPRAYGYSADGWTTIEAEEAEVCWMYEQFNAGASLSGLATELNRRGIPNRSGKVWTHNGVRHVLGNERNAALRTYEGRTYPGKWPAIVTEDVYRAAVARLADPSRVTSPGPASAHLLTGLANCGVDGCVNPGDTDGAPYRVTSGSRGKGQPVYQCSHGKVKHLVRAAPAVNAYVEAVLVERLAAADISALMDGGGTDGEDLADARREAVALRSRLDGLAALVADVDSGMDPAAYAAAVRAVQGRLTVVEAKLASGERGRVLGDFATGRPAADVWAGLALDRRRAVVAMLLDVTVLPAARFSKHRFDPRSVSVTWKGGPVVVEQPDAVTLDGLSDADARDLAAAIREAGWAVERRGGCVTVPRAAVVAAEQVAADLRDFDLTYPMDSGLAVKAAVAAVVEQAPALTAEQRDRLGSLLA